MPKYTEKELSTIRNYSVIKSNELVLKSRYSLSLQEQRIILFLVSKIRKDDTGLTEYPFSIQEFGEICGIDVSGGKEYRLLKDTLKSLSDKSFWAVINDDGTESLLRWISTVRISKKHGVIILKLHEDMIPFLLQLKGRYLDYKLYYVLAMKSMYGIRIYELLKAEHNKKATTFEMKQDNASFIDFDLENLKRVTMTEKYAKFNDFKKRVLEPAKLDINEYSDLIIDYDPIKETRSYKIIRFYVRYKKTVPEGIVAMQKVDRELNARKNTVPLVPSVTFCDNCDMLADDGSKTYSRYVKCTDYLEGDWADKL